MNHNMVSALDYDDVLTEILIRLPAKSLIKFKSVCKKWLSLISSDCFFHQHALRSPKRPPLILQRSGTRLDPDFCYWNPTSINGGENVRIPFALSLPPDHHYQILQACNGLLLLEGFNNFYFNYRVYNPTTKLSTEVNISSGKFTARIALAFDPSKSPYYKIVCIMCRSLEPDDDTFWVEVYDSESCSWKLGLEPFTRPTNFWFSEAQYWNNAIFWWERFSDTLYCFNIAKGEMKPLSTPQSHGKGDCYLQELDGNLYYLRLTYGAVLEYGRSRELLVAAWELGGDRNSEWILKLDDAFISEGVGDYIGLMGGANENLVVLICYQSSEKMKAYSFLHKRGEDVVGFTAPYDDRVHTYNIIQAFQFRETLALV